MSEVPAGSDEERGRELPGREAPPAEDGAEENASPTWRVGRRAPRVGFLGSSGSGKTTLMKACVYSWADEVPDVRFLVHDTTLEWGEEHENVHVFSVQEYSLEDVCSIALELGDCTVVADEVDMETDSRAGLSRESALHAVCNYGRHNNTALLWACRRALDIPRGLTANTKKLFVLLTHEPADLKWLRDKTQDDGTAERAANLSEGDWFLWEAGRRKEQAQQESE